MIQRTTSQIENEIKEAMASVSKWSFAFEREVITERNAILYWISGEMTIEVVYDNYEYSLVTAFQYNGQQVKMRELYDLYGIDGKHIYQFHDDEGVSKGISVVTGALYLFLEKFDPGDRSELEEALSQNVISPNFDQRNERELADRFYLSGQYAAAKSLYLSSEKSLNKLQRKRLADLNQGKPKGDS